MWEPNNRIRPVLALRLPHQVSDRLHSTMPLWTHLIRFVAVEDGHIHLGQLVDTTRDVGEDSVKGVKIQAFVIEGTIFDGRVTQEVLTVEKVRRVTALQSARAAANELDSFSLR